MVASLALTGMLMMAPASAKPEIGKPAPDFTVADSHGKTHKLGDFSGKVVVLEWTNHECPYVKKHYSTGNMQKLQREAAADGVIWLTVISSAKGEQGNLTGAESDVLTQERKAAPAAVLFDEQGAMGRAYEARTTPHMFVITKNGTLAYMGGIDDKPTTNIADIQSATNYVASALRNVEAGKPADPAITRPYGCSVKYGS
jgi:peroxiredoxin